ncbi:unnamed protein product [Blepharisma stoltei]|uniref:Uncharacterized protein n=1 Tax=Blepharisma stoltei TaxID=1481888 RepID=A0AAU9JFS3_9CILI|nr:unnamed protein product [Blepharisma stoltei]
MAIMVGVIGPIQLLCKIVYINNPSQREAAAIKVITKFPIIATVAYCTIYELPIIYLQRKYNLSKAFCMCDIRSYWNTKSNVYFFFIRAVRLISQWNEMMSEAVKAKKALYREN